MDNNYRRTPLEKVQLTRDEGIEIGEDIEKNIGR